MRDLTDAVKALALRLGADLVGVAPVERFEAAPELFKPESLLPGARTVISIAVHHPDACVELCGFPTPHDMGPYGPAQDAMNRLLDHIAFEVAKFLESEGFDALPLPVTNFWRYRRPPGLGTDFVPDFPHIHAAVAAGLGEIGLSGLLLTPEFGPRQRVTTIITAAPLRPDPLYQGPPLCDRCMLCAEACPLDAIRREARRIEVRIGERAFRYPLKNKWRCAWAEHFGLDLGIEPPERVDEGTVLELLGRHGRRGGAMGWCLKFCLPPHLRANEPSLSEPPARRRPAVGESPSASPRRLWLVAVKAAGRHGVDVLCSIPARGLAESGVEVGRLMPSAKAAVGLQVELRGDPILDAELGRRLAFAQLDVARELEKFGFLSLPFAPIPGAEGRGGASRKVGWVLTEAPLPEFVPFRGGGRRRRPRRLPLDLKSALRAVAFEAGADLFGVAPADGGPEPVEFEVLDGVDEGPPHGEPRPRAWRGKVKPPAPRDVLPGARSVVVVGVAMPAACVRGPLGSYAFGCYEAFEQLRRVALELAESLKGWGFEARAVWNLWGAATEVLSPRGRLPDARSNAVAANLAGLAEVGLHGAPITPEFGVLARFVAIVTDAELEPDGPYRGPKLCRPEECGLACVKACPVGALSEDGRVDISRCDWAKKFGLVASEGPGEVGSLTEIRPLEGEIMPEALERAMRSLDPIQKHWLAVREPCLVACQRFLERAGIAGSGAQREG